MGASKNSYKKRDKAERQQVMFPQLLKAMQEEEERAKKEKVWDPYSAEFAEHVVAVSRQNFGGTEKEWQSFEKNILRKHAHVFWDEGCPAPKLKIYEAKINLKEGAGRDSELSQENYDIKA